MDALDRELVWHANLHMALAILAAIGILSFYGGLLWLWSRKRKAPSWPLPLDVTGDWTRAADAALAQMEGAR